MLLGQVRFLSLLTMIDAPLPTEFLQTASSFKWAGLQFPGLIPIEGISIDTNFSLSTSVAIISGPSRYVEEAQASAEALFLSNVVVQLIVIVVVVLLHLLLNSFLKKKTGMSPADLAFPKFELGHLSAMCAPRRDRASKPRSRPLPWRCRCVLTAVPMPLRRASALSAVRGRRYESMMTTAFITLALPALAWVKVIAGVIIILVNGVLFVCCDKLRKVQHTDKLKFNEEKVEGGRLEEWVVLPAKIFVKRMISDEEPANMYKGDWKAENPEVRAHSGHDSSTYRAHARHLTALAISDSRSPHARRQRSSWPATLSSSPLSTAPRRRSSCGSSSSS